MKKYTKYTKKITSKKNNTLSDGEKKNISDQSPPHKEGSIFSTVDENFNFIGGTLAKDIGLIMCKYSFFEGEVQAGIAYIESITDQNLISSQIVEPLLRRSLDPGTVTQDITVLIRTKYIYVPNTEEAALKDNVIKGILNGNTVLFIDGADTALIIGSRKFEKRAIEKPATEITVSASFEAFTEDLETNCSMIIKRLPQPELRFESYTVGKLSNTKIKLIWFEGIVNTKALEEARRRIQKISADTVENVGILSELISDKPVSVFPKHLQTQRPDLAAKYIVYGYFAIACNNSPHFYIAPVTFWDFFKSIDDYAENSVISSFFRITRYAAFVLSLLISPVYLSFVTFNHSIVPPALALNIAIGREGVPFPSVVELLVMTFAVSIIREASLRIQGAVGFFGATLAAVIIGQSAVEAGYISASLIIIIAGTTIASFAMANPSIVHPAIILNFLLILITSVFGIFGLINGIVMIIWHMVSLESFGVPYLHPFVPFDPEGVKNTFIRAPFKSFKKPPYNRP